MEMGRNDILQRIIVETVLCWSSSCDCPARCGGKDSKHHNQIGEVHTHSVTDFAAQSVESVGVFYPRSAAPAHHSTEHGTSLTQNTQNTSSDTY